MKYRILPLFMSLTAVIASEAFARISVNGVAFDSARLILKENGGVVVRTEPKATANSEEEDGALVNTIPTKPLSTADYEIRSEQNPDCSDGEDCNEIWWNITITKISDNPLAPEIVPINCADDVSNPRCEKDDDDPLPNECGTQGQNLVVDKTLVWEKLYAKDYISVGVNTVVSPFTTTRSTNYQGSFTFAPLPESQSFIRYAWISECPGGDAYTADGENVFTLGGVLKNSCESEGNEFTLSWSQKDQPDYRGLCKLKRNAKYYLNYRQEKGYWNVSPKPTDRIIRQGVSSGNVNM